jgi:hypothetical protein
MVYGECEWCCGLGTLVDSVDKDGNRVVACDMCERQVETERMKGGGDEDGRMKGMVCLGDSGDDEDEDDEDDDDGEWATVATRHSPPSSQGTGSSRSNHVRPRNLKRKRRGKSGNRAEGGTGAASASSSSLTQRATKRRRKRTRTGTAVASETLPSSKRKSREKKKNSPGRRSTDTKKKRKKRRVEEEQEKKKKKKPRRGKEGPRPKAASLSHKQRQQAEQPEEEGADDKKNEETIDTQTENKNNNNTATTAGKKKRKKKQSKYRPDVNFRNHITCVAARQSRAPGLVHIFPWLIDYFNNMHSLKIYDVDNETRENVIMKGRDTKNTMVSMVKRPDLITIQDIRTILKRSVHVAQNANIHTHIHFIFYMLTGKRLVTITPTQEEFYVYNFKIYWKSFTKWKNTPNIDTVVPFIRKSGMNQNFVLYKLMEFDEHPDRYWVPLPISEQKLKDNDLMWKLGACDPNMWEAIPTQRPDGHGFNF